MKLLETFAGLLNGWGSVFSQERTFERARRLTFGLLTCLRVHLTSTAICASGRQFQDWSADYRLCSRSPWKPRALYSMWCRTICRSCCPRRKHRFLPLPTTPF